MVKRETALKIRKIHRYLGLFLGIQFLFWTVSGLYFSWSDIDEIHGDHFKNMDYQPPAFEGLVGLDSLKIDGGVRSIELRDIGSAPYYWINDKQLYNAMTGKPKEGITKEEALIVAAQYVKSNLKVKGVKRIDEIDEWHEYREKVLPAYVVSYDNDEELKAYISVEDGRFQTIRHQRWRWFDFLWMTHTMDYEGRDDFNNLVLRAFSLLGLITVFSGFLLWYTSSPTIRKIEKESKK